MRRAHVDRSVIDGMQGGRVVLPADAVHRFLRVLRLEAGTVVEIFDGAGRVVRGKLAPPDALVDVEATEARDPLPPLVVAQAVTKTDKLEMVVQKGTELGASRFVLVDTARGQVHLGDRAEKRRDRLARIAEDAARQCRRATVPAVEGPVDVRALCELVRGFPGVAAAGLVTAQEPLTEALAARRDRLVEGGLLVVVGPEGGLDPKEADALEKAGAVPVRLGVHVLRTETAALVALAAAQAALGTL
jgi:16S rRNA (uracil1498-N3)-methyltransferase